MKDFDDYCEFDDTETFVIKKYLNIENSSKDICFDTQEDYDANDPDQVSEWAMAVALQTFKLNTEITLEKFQEAVSNAKTQQVLDGMVEKGILNMSWNGEEPVYGLSEFGKQIAEELPNSKKGK